ncbi:hypothetical protein T11_2348 [Trichinella zimbabwensis]|nr:hypothetical protein T11_2348 [Trichinella zimbabwensis]
MCVPAEPRMSNFCEYLPLLLTLPLPYKSTKLPESCKGYHRPSTDLHVKYLSHMSGLADQSGPRVWNRGTGAAVDQPLVCSASFPYTLMFLSF